MADPMSSASPLEKTLKEPQVPSITISSFLDIYLNFIPFLPGLQVIFSSILAEILRECFVTTELQAV
jgi:hypothetical protein